MPLGRGSPEWGRGRHSPPGTNSGSGLVSPVARGMPLRSSLVTHLSTKGSVGRKGELEERGRPRQNEGPFGGRPTPGAREGGTRAGRWRRTAPGTAVPGRGAGWSNLEQRQGWKRGQPTEPGGGRLQLPPRSSYEGRASDRRELAIGWPGGRRGTEAAAMGPTGSDRGGRVGAGGSDRPGGWLG